MKQSLKTLITSVSLILTGVFISATIASMPSMVSGRQSATSSFNQATMSDKLVEPAIKSIIKLKGVVFEDNTAVIKNSSYARLDITAKALKQYKDISVVVAAHSNNNGNVKLNKLLTSERAKTVQDYLISKGVKASQLTYKGYGADLPLSSNKTNNGRSTNERMELRVY